ncbi:nuclear transport factor 2 family protein [Endozoicomonas sp. 4G]|uniref:nuclear transport factor 2 family protein n=1 Tax=Endozoicomonas sp. 4G TaxID=2872754 RepID=UPI00207890F0|nr:nuclear transport factor 2 family protein [Endozoicomonas sp. 4G]
MAMSGFDPRWRDFSHYILGITREIWEERKLHTLKDYYAPDVIVRSPSSIVTGCDKVISATMSTLAEFPDRTLLGEDVIWSGTPEQGMLSSHRITTTATHTGNGIYGNATGKSLRYRVIADCHAKNNQIDDEWLVRDQGDIARQLGMSACEYARWQIECEGGLEKCLRPFTPDQDVEGPYQGVGNDNEWGLKHEDILSRIMNAEFSVIPQAYDRACMLELPGGQRTVSHKGADDFWMQLRSAFPEARFTVHHRIGRQDDLRPPRSAIRWSLHGKHEGSGAFGTATGAEVHVMGITHAEFGPWGLNREFTLFDETAVWKQILIHKG